MSTGTAFAIVDAFTTQQPFSGNPAGVMLLDDFPDDEWMQGVANELHQSETDFLVPGEEPGAFGLRWFTPTTEVALCGHATLASAHWLWEAGVLLESSVAAFATRSGRLTAERDGDRIVLDFPAVPASQVASSPDLLAALDGTIPVWTGITSNADPGERNMLAVLASEEAVRNLTPDLQAVTRLSVGGLIVTRATLVRWCRGTSPPPTGSPRTQSQGRPTAPSAPTGAASSERHCPPNRLPRAEEH